MRVTGWRRVGVAVVASVSAACLASACGSSSKSGSSSSASSGSPNKVSASAAYCQQARVVANETVSLGSNPAGVKADFGSFYRLQALAPDLIRPDVVVLSDFYKRVASLLPARPTRDQVSNAVQKAASEKEFAGVPNSASTVTNFTQQACGVNLAPSASS